MKSSLGKLRKLAFHKTNLAAAAKEKEKRNLQSPAHLDELVQASEDMQDMRNCYDSLLSAAAATANSAYEFSESLREMGTCLLEATPNDDEESGKALIMLGQVQLEIQKLVDCYRSHVIMTITNPSESLLNELLTVEEMKRQCDEKRKVYEYMLAQQRDKAKSKSGKGENFTQQQLQIAQDEYEEEATLCVFRLKSLKQGQSRSLLTQAARHHAAQLNFFRKGLNSLDAVEPRIRSITEQQHIDYQFSGLNDDELEDVEDDGDDSYDTNDCGELSFDNKPSKQGLDPVSKSRDSMELDPVDISYRQLSTKEDSEVNLDNDRGDPLGLSREPRRISHSAPIFAEKKPDFPDMRKTQPSTRKLTTYALPTPVNTVPGQMSASVSHTRPATHVGNAHSLWHSSPLEPKRNENDEEDNTSGLMISKIQSVLKESNSNETASKLPPPLAESFLRPLIDPLKASDHKRVKRQAFSGPLASKPSTKPLLSSSGPIGSKEPHLLVAGLLTSRHHSSPKVSPSASPPHSSPMISELHELPRPPDTLGGKPAKYHSPIGHSAPLFFRNQDISVTHRIRSGASNTASPLPTPPLSVSRSFSIPSSNHRAMALHMPKHLDSSLIQEKAGHVASPPLTPISLTNINQVSTISDVISQSGQIRGGGAS